MIIIYICLYVCMYVQLTLLLTTYISYSLVFPVVFVDVVVAAGLHQLQQLYWEKVIIANQLRNRCRLYYPCQHLYQCQPDHQLHPDDSTDDVGVSWRSHLCPTIHPKRVIPPWDCHRFHHPLLDAAILLFHSKDLHRRHLLDQRHHFSKMVSPRGRRWVLSYRSEDI